MAKALVILEYGALPPDADDGIDDEDRSELQRYINRYRDPSLTLCLLVTD